jgi:hypothetical protein
MGRFAATEAIANSFGLSENPRLRARGMWCTGTLKELPGVDDLGSQVVANAVRESSPEMRIAAIRLANQLKLPLSSVAALAKDSAPEVRRELAIALRHSKSAAAAGLWADLAMQHDGNDRWYLEALGIGADKQWDAFFDAYLAKVSEPTKTPAGRAVIWRSRAKKTPELLVKIIKDPATSEEEQKKYFRALDFLSGPERETALKSLLE